MSETSNYSHNLNNFHKIKSYNIFGLEDVEKIIKENKHNDIDLEGRTITFTVCRIGCLKTLKYLIINGADFRIRDTFGCTCLATACGVGNLEIVKYLIEELKMDINEKNIKNQSLAFTASKCGRLNILEYLTYNGVDLTLSDNSGSNCLIIAINRNNLHIAKFLIEQKIKPIDINDYDDSGMDALMYACKSGNFDAVKLLVENGINLNNLSSKGKNCMYFATTKGKKNMEIINYLSSKGAIVIKSNVVFEKINKIKNNNSNNLDNLDNTFVELPYLDFEFLTE